MHSPLSPPDAAFDRRFDAPATSAAYTPASGSVATQEPEPSAERDRRFVGMLRAFRSTGGLLRGDEVSERQWRDVQAIARVQGERLDREHLRLWAGQLGVMDLLDRVMRSVI